MQCSHMHELCISSHILYFLIEIYLLYNVVFIFTVQQGESAMCIHISPPSRASLSPPFPPSRSSQSLELSSLWSDAASPYRFYTLQYIYVNATFNPSHPLLSALCPQVCSLHLHLYSCPIGSSELFFQIPYIYINIQYLFFSFDLLHSV